MIYSAWNQAAKLYDYYETPEQQTTINSSPPKHIRGGSDLGVTPEEAAWPIPTKAVLIGSGQFAKGRVANKPGTARMAMSGLGSISTSPFSLILTVIGAYYIWSKLKRK